MKNSIGATLIIAVALLSCDSDGKNWTALSEQEAHVLIQPCSRSFPKGLSGYWMPERTEIQLAETRFQEALTRSLRRVAKSEHESVPPAWYTQYAGFFRNGRKVIYVNAVRSDVMVEGWRDRAIVMCDGGIGSFGAVLDLDRDVVDSFEFNGSIGGPIQLDAAEDEKAAQSNVVPETASPRR